MMSDTPYTVRLPASFVDDTIHETHKDLLGKLSGDDVPTSIGVDASAVEGIKTPGVQLLLWLQQTAKAKKINLTINNPSDYFNRFCTMLGATVLLPDEFSSDTQTAESTF